MEKGSFCHSAVSSKMELPKTKFSCWRFSSVGGLIMIKNDLQSVQLQLGKSSGKERVILERPVDKTVLLVENEKC